MYQNKRNFTAEEGTQSGDDKLGFKELESMDEWDKVIATKDKPILIQCSADWCRPCQMLKPLMKEAVWRQEGKVQLYYIDVDKFPDIAGML